MTQKVATILHINLLSNTFEIKVREDLWPLIGGIGYALYLLKENPSASVISVGPLTGAFPGCDICYLSKVDREKKKIILEEISGELALSFKNLGWDALVIEGEAKKEIQIKIDESTLVIFSAKNLAETKIKSDSEKKVVETENYREIYEKILLAVSTSIKSEMEPKINLASCLGARGAYQEIFEGIPLAFATLESIGINYSHEELEEGLEIVYNLKEEIESLI